MSTYVAVFEEDGTSSTGRLVAASAEPDVVGQVARLLLGSIPVRDADPIIAQLNAGRRRALQMVVDVAEFIAEPPSVTDDAPRPGSGTRGSKT